MKVFRINTEYLSENNEVIEQVQYVTHEANSLLKVTEYFTEDCKALDIDLKAVCEVLTIVQHLEVK